MKKYLDLIILVTSLIFCILSFYLKSNIATFTVLFISFLGIPFFLKFPISEIPDERDLSLHLKASSTTLATIIILLLFGIMTQNNLPLLRILDSKYIMQLLLVIIYETYFASYIIYNRVN